MVRGQRAKVTKGEIKSHTGKNKAILSFFGEAQSGLESHETVKRNLPKCGFGTCTHWSREGSLERSPCALRRAGEVPLH